MINVLKTTRPWLGMVNIPPMKMVMTGGWLIIILPTSLKLAYEMINTFFQVYDIVNASKSLWGW